MTLQYLHEDLTQQTIEAFFALQRQLKAARGYKDAELVQLLCQELRQRDLDVKALVPARRAVGGASRETFYLDLVVDEKVVVKVKKLKSSLTDRHTDEMYVDLLSTPYNVGLIVNFGPYGKKNIRRVFVPDEEKKR